MYLLYCLNINNEDTNLKMIFLCLSLSIHFIKFFKPKLINNLN